MADQIKTGIFAKNVQKRLNRAQEKVLQKLGKADETKDEQFEQVVVNFRRQESEGSRLQREMKSYMAAIKGMQQASINLSQSLHEVYEPDWHGKEEVLVIGKDCDALWEDFHNKLIDATLLNMDGYLQQFPDLKTRVAKRSRKLIDYDSARHHVETLALSGMKSDRRTMKADEELRKAQRVFEELDLGLQDELPSLWENRVSFYISSFKCITNLEAKFHREISLVCRQLYEVMTSLSEQHADKMFTIQGAPSDSGPLRLARTPSPPSDDSPPQSPEASNHTMLRPVSPGPPRPKSPAQFKKGPPVPPPPKATPTKEVAEEQIIDLFGGEFFAAPSPSQPNERPGESLLDMDFDAFQPDDSVSPIPQTAVPWDMWSGQAPAAQPAGDGGFVADWSADFGAPANGEASGGGAKEEEGQGWAQTDTANDANDANDAAAESTTEAAEVSGWGPGGEPEDYTQDHSDRRESDDYFPSIDTDRQSADYNDRRKSSEYIDRRHSTVYIDRRQSLDSDRRQSSDYIDRRLSTPNLIFTNELGQQIEDSTEERWMDGSGSEYETADDELSYEVMMTSEGGGASEHESDSSVYREETDSADLTAETQTGGTLDSDPFAETQGAEQGGQGAFVAFAETGGDGLGGWDKDPFAETQGGEAQTGGAFDSDLFAETQGDLKGDQGAFDAFAETAETQGGGAFDKDPFAETQTDETQQGAFDAFAETGGEGAFDAFAETAGEGAFDSDPFAETQGTEQGEGFDAFTETQTGGAFAETGGDGSGGWDKDPFAETQTAEIQGLGAFDKDPFAETQGEVTGDQGAFDAFTETADTQGGGAFDKDPFAETGGVDKVGGGEFDAFAETGGDGSGGWDKDPFAETQTGETQAGGAFDAFAETQGGGAFDAFAETQGGGAFDAFAETQGGGAFEKDPFAETGGEGTGGWDKDPFAETQAAETQAAETQAVGAFDAFAETGGDGKGAFDAFAETGGDGKGAFDAFAETGGDGKGAFDSDPFADGFPAASAANVNQSEGVQAVMRAHREPEHSDMSEDEAANRRFGKIYQEVEKQKLEDTTAPSFFADFDAMNDVDAKAAAEKPATPEEKHASSSEEEKLSSPEEPTEQSPTEEPLAPPPAAEEPLAPPPAEEPVAPPPAAEEPVAPPPEAETDQSEPSVQEEKAGSPLKEEKPDVPAEEAAATSPAEAGPSEQMPIPSVVIEPASSNEGDDDRDHDIISPVTHGNGTEAPPLRHMSPSGGTSGNPDDFLYKVETMHDFEAANSDELELKRGDVVLVVPTLSAEDQEAGWLTGYKESEWLTLGVGAHKGLFPENFIQRLE